MDDRELQLAIAEELGWKFIPYPDDCYAKKRHWWQSPVGGITNQFGERWFLNLPLDWPGDIAAAMTLIDDGKGDCQSIDCATIEFLAGEWRVGMSYGMKVSGKHINKSLSRAISEAWLSARKDVFQHSDSLSDKEFPNESI